MFQALLHRSQSDSDLSKEFQGALDEQQPSKSSSFFLFSPKIYRRGPGRPYKVNNICTSKQAKNNNKKARCIKMEKCACVGGCSPPGRSVRSGQLGQQKIISYWFSQQIIFSHWSQMAGLEQMLAPTHCSNVHAHKLQMHYLREFCILLYFSTRPRFRYAVYSLAKGSFPRVCIVKRWHSAYTHYKDTQFYTSLDIRNCAHHKCAVSCPWFQFELCCCQSFHIANFFI